MTTLLILCLSFILFWMAWAFGRELMRDMQKRHGCVELAPHLWPFTLSGGLHDHEEK